MEMIVGANGNGHMTLAQLEKKLDKLRKPGRPSLKPMVTRTGS